MPAPFSMWVPLSRQAGVRPALSLEFMRQEEVISVHPVISTQRAIRASMFRLGLHTRSHLPVS